MIFTLAVLVLAIAGNIWLWRRLLISERTFRAQLAAQHEQHVAELHRAEHRIDLVLSAHTYEQNIQRERLTDELAARDRQLADQQAILAGIVTFLDEVPQNFRFDRVPGQHFRLRLPDRLRMELHDTDA